VINVNLFLASRACDTLNADGLPLCVPLLVCLHEIDVDADPGGTSVSRVFQVSRESMCD
jgi:hypothetical protein